MLLTLLSILIIILHTFKPTLQASRIASIKNVCSRFFQCQNRFPKWIPMYPIKLQICSHSSNFQLQSESIIIKGSDTSRRLSLLFLIEAGNIRRNEGNHPLALSHSLILISFSFFSFFSFCFFSVVVIFYGFCFGT